MLAYGLLLAGAILLYAVFIGNGRRVWEAVIGQPAAGNIKPGASVGQRSSVQGLGVQTSPNAATGT